MQQEVNNKQMQKQEPLKVSTREPSTGSTTKEDRYYTQRLSEQIFVIRERLSTNTGPAPDDRIVRSFIIGHDASQYTDNINAKQRKLDEQYGHWIQNAAEKEQA